MHGQTHIKFVQYCVHNNPPILPIISQKNPIHILPPYFFTAKE